VPNAPAPPMPGQPMPGQAAAPTGLPGQGGVDIAAPANIQPPQLLGQPNRGNYVASDPVAGAARPQSVAPAQPQLNAQAPAAPAPSSPAAQGAPAKAPAPQNVANTATPAGAVPPPGASVQPKPAVDKPNVAIKSELSSPQMNQNLPQRGATVQQQALPVPQNQPAKPAVEIPSPTATKAQAPLPATNAAPSGPAQGSGKAVAPNPVQPAASPAASVPAQPAPKTDSVVGRPAPSAQEAAPKAAPAPVGSPSQPGPAQAADDPCKNCPCANPQPMPAMPVKAPQPAAKPGAVIQGQAVAPAQPEPVVQNVNSADSARSQILGQMNGQPVAPQAAANPSNVKAQAGNEPTQGQKAAWQPAPASAGSTAVQANPGDGKKDQPVKAK
jgi:hypothetical protein